MKTLKKQRFAKYSLPQGPQLHQELIRKMTQLLSRKSNDEEILHLLEASLDASVSWDPFLHHLDHSARNACAELYLLNRQVVALVKKYEAHPRELARHYDPERSARTTWLECEELCSRTNSSITFREESIQGLLFRMRSYISRILGVEPDMKEVYSSCYFSKGAALGVSGDRTNLARKFLAAEWTATPGCRAHIVPALLASGLFREGLEVCDLDAPPLREFLSKVRWVSGNKLAFVPKTMSTHRAIAVEPLLNGYLQSGVDAAIRRRLVSRGVVDLRTQVPNQQAARIGSIDGSIATIDLSSASDTIARELVRNLLPYGWWRLVEELRSPITDFAGKQIRLEKCFSQGNNFCFPLQTLIFSAVCHASGAHWFRVYGDDIVVESRVYETLCANLRALGFVPNVTKSFNEGPFRESCGADWYSGKPVRPVFAKKCWTDVRSIMSFHNIALRVWPEGWHWILKDLRDSIPDRMRFVRHRFTDDGSAFNVELDEAMASRYYSWNTDTQSWVWREFLSLPIADRGLQDPYLPFTERKARLRSPGEEPFVCRRKTRTLTVLTHGRDYPPIPGWMPTTVSDIQVA